MYCVSIELFRNTSGTLGEREMLNCTLKIDFLPYLSDEGLTLEKSACESLYGGQFTLLTQLIKPTLSTEVVPQFLKKLTPNTPDCCLLIQCQLSLSVFSSSL